MGWVIVAMDAVIETDNSIVHLGDEFQCDDSSRATTIAFQETYVEKEAVGG